MTIHLNQNPTDLEARTTLPYTLNPKLAEASMCLVAASYGVHRVAYSASQPQEQTFRINAEGIRPNISLPRPFNT